MSVLKEFDKILNGRSILWPGLYGTALPGKKSGTICNSFFEIGIVPYRTIPHTVQKFDVIPTYVCLLSFIIYYLVWLQYFHDVIYGRHVPITTSALKIVVCTAPVSYTYLKALLSIERYLPLSKINNLRNAIIFNDAGQNAII